MFIQNACVPLIYHWKQKNIIDRGKKKSRIEIVNAFSIVVWRTKVILWDLELFVQKLYTTNRILTFPALFRFFDEFPSRYDAPDLICSCIRKFECYSLTLFLRKRYVHVDLTWHFLLSSSVLLQKSECFYLV